MAPVLFAGCRGQGTYQKPNDRDTASQAGRSRPSSARIRSPASTTSATVSRQSGRRGAGDSAGYRPRGDGRVKRSSQGKRMVFLRPTGMPGPLVKLEEA